MRYLGSTLYGREAPMPSKLDLNDRNEPRAQEQDATRG